MRLDGARGFVFDIDGTLAHRAAGRMHVQPGAVEVLERIRASGRRFVLFTNGSHIAPEGFAEELRGVGLPIEDDAVLTPLCSVRTYLLSRGLETPILALATDPARAYLERSGVQVADDGASVDVVFVAHPPAFGFDELERAARAVLAGAKLLTGSYAAAYAGADGPILSRGAMVTAAISKVTGVRPIVVGKPSRAGVRVVEERLGLQSSEVVVIGDDVTMDVALGRLGGSRTVLVRSGMTGMVEPGDLPESRRPDAVVDGVAELLDWL